jgi:hypothetical protein
MHRNTAQKLALFLFVCDQGLQLSFAELKAHFGVPLTEAAARLGVQRQDLVRSCRCCFPPDDALVVSS